MKNSVKKVNPTISVIKNNGANVCMAVGTCHCN